MITIIGNGESRKNINISEINGMKVGCNAIYLHEKIDLICAMDKFWRDKIEAETNLPLISRKINNGFQNTLQIRQNGKWISTTCPYRGYVSGTSALDYVCHYYKDDIYLIGFDFDYTGDLVNHMYKDTPNHPRSTRPAQNENIFLNETLQIIKRYPKHNITWVNDSDVDFGFQKISIKEFKQL